MKQVSTSPAGDNAIDRLLRSRVAKDRATMAPCAGFDPDLANAYIERVLDSGETSRYESHLSDCAPCRKAVAVLMRLAEPEAVGKATAGAGRRARAQAVVASAEGFGLRKILGAMLRPQWALAAIAVVVLAITLPLVISRQSSKSVQPTVNDLATEARQAQALNATRSVAAETSLREGARKSEVVADNRQRSQGQAAAQSDSDDGRLVSNELANSENGALSEVDAVAKKEAAKEEQSQDSKAHEQARSAPEPAATSKPPAEAKVPVGGGVGTQPKYDQPKLARIDEKSAQRLPQNDKETAQVTVLKQAHTDGEAREGKDATIRPEDALPPSPTVGGVEIRGRRSLTQPAAPKMAMRDSGPGDSVRAKPREERKVSNKKFFLRGDVWTDKDYNPLKEMPVVTIVRDSDVYREVMAKHSGLKQYFTNFGERDRAIIVYKGTVYKLIPQDASK
jgi:hypothetical protein